MIAAFKQDVLFYQRFLKSNGFYTGQLDGGWGPKTDAADVAFTNRSNEIKEQWGTFDTVSESHILTLIPAAQIAARQFLTLVKPSGKDIKILSGTRTYAEQNALYSKGRTTAGPIVTKAKGGQSNHNFGLAWDIGVFENGNYIGNDTPYKSIPTIVLPQMPQLEWGGNWISMKDYPHYQIKSVSASVSVIRGLFEAGKSYLM